MSIFTQKSKYDFLIVGLGNPTPKYENNRHNTGFKTLDAIMEKFGASQVKIKGNALGFECKINGKKCLLVKPLDFMNNSGKVLRAVSGYYKIPLDKIIVIYDDISLPVGRIRIREKGSAGGHNGVNDIIMQFNSEEFLRIKIGVGGKPDPAYDLAAWVLSDFRKEEKAPLEEAESHAIRALALLLDGELEKAKSIQNS